MNKTILWAILFSILSGLILTGVSSLYVNRRGTSNPFPSASDTGLDYIEKGYPFSLIRIGENTGCSGQNDLMDIGNVTESTNCKQDPYPKNIVLSVLFWSAVSGIVAAGFLFTRKKLHV